MSLPDFQYRVPDEFRRIADYQVAGSRVDASAFARQSRWEFGALAPLLPTAPRRVLDLGCGLGRATVYLNALLGDPEVEFILADTTEIPTEPPRAGWDPGPDFYNDLEWTSRFVESNGVQRYRTFDIRRDDWGSLADVDLVISLLAVGFHFPIEPALPALLGCTRPDATLAFGIRTGRYSRFSFADTFRDRRVVRGAPDHPSSLKERFLVLRDRREQSAGAVAGAAARWLDPIARGLQVGAVGLERRVRRLTGTLPGAPRPDGG